MPKQSRDDTYKSYAKMAMPSAAKGPTDHDKEMAQTQTGYLRTGISEEKGRQTQVVPMSRKHSEMLARLRADPAYDDEFSKTWKSLLESREGEAPGTEDTFDAMERRRTATWSTETGGEMTEDDIRSLARAEARSALFAEKRRQWKKANRPAEAGEE